MPTIAELIGRHAGIALTRLPTSLSHPRDTLSALVRRIYIPCCDANSPPGLVQASTVDPWSASGQYALGWVYFCVILLAFAVVARIYNFFTDKIRIAVHKDEFLEGAKETASDTSYEMSQMYTDKSTNKLFPREAEKAQLSGPASSGPSNRLMDICIALLRSVFYRTMPDIRYRRGWRPIAFPSLAVSLIAGAALVFTMLYTFIPQPLYWSSMAFGSPPVAIRAGMIAVAMMPWIIALSMKANFISMMTGIGHERLNVLHRWAAWLFLLLSLIHAVPFYIQPTWDQNGYLIFNSYISQTGVILYGSGIAALVPAIFLCLHSVPPLRRAFYEVFIAIHVPLSIILLAMLFWHCANYLTSWAYLWATVGIWAGSYTLRLLYLNWTNPFRMSWLVGEECAITVMQEDAVKITIPTQVAWRPGQYVYLRMPGISIFENHPFTIASLCSEEFPSGYGEEYKDMVLVFRPFGGFTRKVLHAALDHGPWHTYRAFIDGPYGGMRRTLHSFDHVVLIAGGSGVTALVSHLLDLVKRMRDGKAVTKHVHIIWALKRPEIMEWFKEELRICREYAPPDSVHCQFYITAAKRQSGRLVSAHTPGRPLSAKLHNAVNDIFQSVASNRYSTASSHRNSALIMDEAAGDTEREKQLRFENEDRLRPLPQAHLKTLRAPSPTPGVFDATQPHATPHMPPHPTLHEKRRVEGAALKLEMPASNHVREDQIEQIGGESDKDFGFPQTPTEFQKSLMRFAFMPAAVRHGAARKSGWSTEWGRPDISYMLTQMSHDWNDGLSRRACVFVCGPPSMRVDVSNTVAGLQRDVLERKGALQEVYLHTENYAL